MTQAFPTKQTSTFDATAEYSTQLSQSPQTAYLTSNTLGTPRINTNAAGAVFSRHDYQPYGEEVGGGVGARSQALGYAADDVRKQFTGYERDDESGLDFAEARMYANQLGRFTTVDPIMMKVSRTTDPQQINLFAYVRNNPFKYVDTDGNDLIPANEKSASQLRTDLSKILSKAEYSNLNITAGKNIGVINPDFQSNSTAYQELVAAISSDRSTTYYSVAEGSSVSIDAETTLSWNDVRGGAAVPLDGNLAGASKVNIYVPESGGNSQVDGQNGQQIDQTRDLVTLHEIGHNNCGAGQCAVDVENKIRNEKGLPLRSGRDHESIPTDKVQTSMIALPTVSVTSPVTTIVPMPASRTIPVTIPLRKRLPLPQAPENY